MRRKGAPVNKAPHLLTLRQPSTIFSPPTETAPGIWETEHRGHFLGGSVDIVFIYEEFGGEWLLTYDES